MKNQIKRRWIAALRSGEYRKGKGALCKSTQSGDVFCCLGVLTQMAIEDGVLDGWDVAPGRSSRLGVVEKDGTIEIDGLPEVVRKWAGLHEAFPNIVTDDYEKSLAELNDGSKGYSPQRPLKFSEIADLIETHL